MSITDWADTYILFFRVGGWMDGSGQSKDGEEKIIKVK